MNKPFIAIEGPIGVGKSSLAHKLSQTLDFYEEKEINSTGVPRAH